MSWVRMGSQRLISEQVLRSASLRAEIPRIVGEQITEMLEDMAAKAASDEDAVVAWTTLDVEVRPDPLGVGYATVLRSTVEAQRDDTKSVFKAMGEAMARREGGKRRGS